MFLGQRNLNVELTCKNNVPRSLAAEADLVPLPVRLTASAVLVRGRAAIESNKIQALDTHKHFRAYTRTHHTQPGHQRCACGATGCFVRHSKICGTRVEEATTPVGMRDLWRHRMRYPQLLVQHTEIIVPDNPRSYRNVRM